MVLFFPGWQDWPSAKYLRKSAEPDVLHSAWFDGKEAYLYRRASRKQDKAAFWKEQQQDISPNIIKGKLFS